MKTRIDFVTNSSSSSFIIACNKIPSDMYEAAEVWFGNKKGFIGPLIIEGLFNGLKEFKLDLTKLLEDAKTYNISRYGYYDNEDEISSERIVLQGFASEFTNEEEYGRSYFLSPDSPTRFKVFEKEELKKLMDKYPDAKREWDLPYEERKKIEEAWYKKPEVKERFINTVQEFVNRFEGFEFFMHGEFADEEGELGAELEHGDHWGKFPEIIRFSHH